MTTSIEWTDHTINPGIYGCTEVSPACANCYAAGMAHRLVAMGVYPDGITEKRSSGVHWSGKVSVDYDQIEKAFAKLPKRKNARVFVTSMSDLFHEDVEFAFVHDVFEQMEARPHLTFQVLTKRPERMQAFWQQWQEGDYKQYVDDGVAPEDVPVLEWPTNVWAGCTVEDQKRADERIPHLLRVPAKVRFLSVEPMVGAVDLDEWLKRREHCGDCGAILPPSSEDICTKCGESGTLITTWGSAQSERKTSGERYDDRWHEDLQGSPISWVICGGESGSKARPSNPAWFRSLRDQCDAAGVAYFFKQWGRWVGAEDCEKAQDLGLIPHGWCEQSPDDGGRPYHQWTRDKVHAGKVYVMPAGESYWLRPGEDPKTLDGVKHHEFPE